MLGELGERAKRGVEIRGGATAEANNSSAGVSGVEEQGVPPNEQ